MFAAGWPVTDTTQGKLAPIAIPDILLALTGIESKKLYEATTSGKDVDPFRQSGAYPRILQTGDTTKNLKAKYAYAIVEVTATE